MYGNTEKKVAELERTMAKAEDAKIKFLELARGAEARKRETYEALGVANVDFSATRVAWAEQEVKLNDEIVPLQQFSNNHRDTIIAEYKKFDDFVTYSIGELIPHYDPSKNFILGMASSNGVPIDQLLSWTTVIHYCARARLQHGVIKYSEDEFHTDNEHDEDDEVEPWTPLPLTLPINVTKLVAHIQAGNGSRWENNQLTLTNLPSPEADEPVTDEARPDTPAP